MGRSPCCSKVSLHRGPWSTKEDTLLKNYIKAHGEGKWKSLPSKAGLLRCGKSCRLRWMNYLRPGIKRGNITPEEDDLIIRLHSLLGNRWSLIAGRLPGRTDNEIKNYWNTHLGKKLKNEGKQPSQRTEDITTKIKEKKMKNCDEEVQTETKSCVQNSSHEKVHTETSDFSWPPFELEDGNIGHHNNGDSDEEVQTETKLCVKNSGHEEPYTQVSDFFSSPLFELEDGNIDHNNDDLVCDENQDKLLFWRSGLVAASNDDDILEKVYDEYVQLL